MATFEVRFVKNAQVTVEIEADDEETAADEAWDIAQAYLGTLKPDSRGTAISMDLDGVGADEVTPL